MRYFMLMITLAVSLFSAVCFGADEPLKMIIISEEAAMTPDDVSNANLYYSKKNRIMVLKVNFSDKGKEKFERLFKSNKGKKLALIDGASVIMKPVYLQTETLSGQLDIFIEDERVALNLLKNLSR